MIEVFIEDQPVDGSPFACNVYNINNIKVTGLDSAKVNCLQSPWYILFCYVHL